MQSRPQRPLSSSVRYLVQPRKIAKLISFFAGLALAIAGLVLVAIAASGAFSRGQSGAYIAGAALMAVAAPLISVPLSPRFAKFLALLVLAGFAFAMLWLGFISNSAMPSLSFQVAAIAFVLLVLLRVVLVFRRKRPQSGT